MSIILLILQILGMILLAAATVLLILLLLLLFSPLSYDIRGTIDTHSKEEETSPVGEIFFRGHYALGLVGYGGDCDGQQLRGWLRIIFFYKRLEISFDQEEKKEEARSRKQSKKPKGSLITRWFLGIHKIQKAYPMIRKMIEDEKNHAAVAFLKQKILLLFKKILPKRISIEGSFAAGEPDRTGKACGILALFPMVYGDGWHLLADFTAEEGYLDAKFFAKGRIFIYPLMIIFLQIYSNRDCRRMYAMIRQFQEKMKQVDGKENR